MAPLLAIEFRPLQTTGAMWTESRPILRGLATICLVLGLSLVVLAAYTAVQKYARVKHWIPTEALVLQFEVVNEPHGRVMSDYRAHFTFQYEVGGRTVIASTQSEDTTSSDMELRHWRRTYVAGRHQPIRYNPMQPLNITTDDFDFWSFRQPI